MLGRLVCVTRGQFRSNRHQYTREEHRGIKPNATTLSVADLRSPHLWYPAAYSMKRRVVLHVGPTNSGKTFTAIQRLVTAPSAVYCGPLRLLAAEIYDRLNNEYKVPCSLVTGQQIIDEPNAKHIACTVEMADLLKPVDVAVIDEYQLISDYQRGWAWTRAFLGLQASEIHLTGDLSRIELIKHMCSLTGDELEVKHYERLLPLEVEKGLSGSPRNIMPGDAVIAFSRKDVFALKRTIELHTNHKCCVVYGNLPPESRKRQAELFNSASPEYSVLVGTDAIGMGLNLNIRRIVFSSVKKFDGLAHRLLTPSEVKQIAGRAGRYKSDYPSGKVTCLYDRDLRHVHKHLDKPLPKDSERVAMLMPLYEQFDMLANIDPTFAFSDMVNFFRDNAKVDQHFCMAEIDTMHQKAKCIDDLDMELEDRYIFCMAPLDCTTPELRRYFYRFARDFSEMNEVKFNKKIPQLHFGGVQIRLSMLEEMYKVCDAYLWLSNRFSAFVDAEYVTEMMEEITLEITQTLATLNQDVRSFLPHRRSRGASSTGKPKPRAKKSSGSTIRKLLMNK